MKCVPHFIAFLLLAVLPPLAQAQTWPVKPVRIMIGYGPGSGSDIEARFLASHLEQSWKSPVIVEARPGAGGIIGADYVAKAAPDGYTLLITTGGIATFQALFKAMPFDLLRDFDPVSVLNDTAPVFLTSNNVPARTLPEFVAYAKANPGRLNYGSAGRNTLLLMIESLKLASGIQMTEIPYAGQNLYVTALLRNDVQLVITSSSAAKSLVEDGRLKALAVFGAQRAPNLPDVPTVGEQGYPMLRGSGWFGLLAPRSTPRDIIDKLAAEIPRFAATPAQKERAAKGGFTWVASTPGQFRDQLAGEVRFWTDVAQKAGIRPE